MFTENAEKRRREIAEREWLQELHDERQRNENRQRNQQQRAKEQEREKRRTLEGRLEVWRARRAELQAEVQFAQRARDTARKQGERRPESPEAALDAAQGFALQAGAHKVFDRAQERLASHERARPR